MSANVKSKFVTVTTDLPLPAEKAFALAHKLSVFDHIVWPVIGFALDEETVAKAADPGAFGVGDSFSAPLKFLMVIPAWTHKLTIVEDGPLNSGAFEIYTNEASGPVSTWNHRLTFEPTGDSSCRYTDQIEVEGGLLTLPSTIFVKLFFRYRQWRWRQLAAAIA